MSDDFNDGHMTFGVLVSYFAGFLNDKRKEVIELHLADCDSCAAMARQVHATNRELRSQVEGWTAASHAQAVATASSRDDSS